MRSGTKTESWVLSSSYVLVLSRTAKCKLKSRPVHGSRVARSNLPGFERSEMSNGYYLNHQVQYKIMSRK